MQAASFECIGCGAVAPLDALTYDCGRCGALLRVAHPSSNLRAQSAQGWRDTFAARQACTPGPLGSGVWRFHEWVLPQLPSSDVVTLGEGNSPLVYARGPSEAWGVELYIKQCGHTATGSFKDLGMTVLVSWVNHLRRLGTPIRAVACASTGDTSAALAAYGAAAGIPTVVLLPKGKISAAQLVQPLSNGARVLALDTDFDGCMAHMQNLAREEGVYLANSKNSLRIEGQKTVAFEIAMGLGTPTAYALPDWVAIPGGNLGNVSALVAGFQMLADAGLTAGLPRVLCAQSSGAAPLYASFKNQYAPLRAVAAQDTWASAIRIGNPVSFPKAVEALRRSRGVVDAVSEDTLAEVARDVDAAGLYVCPHTAVALGAVRQQRHSGAIAEGARVVVVSTAHGLKFTEFKQGTLANQPVDVPNDYAAVRRAVLGGA